MAAPTSAAPADFEADRGLDVPIAADQRVDLAQPADRGAGDLDRGRAARVQERLRRRLEAELDAELAGERLQRGLEREEVGGLAAAAPGARHQRADSEAAQPVRLSEGRRPLAREDAGQRPLADRVEPQVDLAGLEEGDALGVAGEVAGGDVEQRAEQRRPHPRLVFGERVGEQHRIGARIALGDPQPAGLAGAGEAPADDLVEAEAAQPVLGPAPQLLFAAEAADPLRHRRQRRRQVLVEAVDAPDLLDQVDLADDVVVALGRDLTWRSSPSTATPKPSRSR